MGMWGRDLNPRPSLFFASVLSFVPCVLLTGLELVCVLGGVRKKGRGEVRGGSRWGGA